jgi:hypothetical protein
MVAVILVAGMAMTVVITAVVTAVMTPAVAGMILVGEIMVVGLAVMVIAQVVETALIRVDAGTAQATTIPEEEATEATEEEQGSAQ